MAEKNEDTENAFIDYLKSVIGDKPTIAFHLLIRRIRQRYYIGETARGYAWNARDILGEDQDLIRRFLESVPLPRNVEAILSDPFYDYKGDRGESMFWGYGPTRYITDVERAAMRKRRLEGWSESPPAKRIVPEKVDDPIKKDEDEAHEKVRPGTSKYFQSDDRAIPCCSKSVKMYELSRSSSELAIEEDNSGDDGKVLTDEGLDASESNNQTEKSCAEGAETDGSCSESTKEEDNYGEHLQLLEGGSDNSGSLHSDYQAIPSGSDGEYTDENLSVSSESVKEADSNEDDGEVPLELSVHSWESLNSSNEAKQLFSEEEGTDEHSGDSREDGEILEDSDNSGSIHSDNQAPPCSDGEETDGDESNSPEY